MAASRRMFALEMVDSDAFLSMEHSTQSLYFHLCMRADDDGFINGPLKITRMVNAKESDLKTLLEKRFLIGFDSGIVVVKHWNVHNQIRKDRRKRTLYIEEYEMLEHKKNGAYKALVDNLATIDGQDGENSQHRLVKSSIVKYSIDNNISGEIFEYSKPNNCGQVDEIVDNSDSGKNGNPPKPPEKKSHDYLSVFNHYQSLGLIKHRVYTKDMQAAIKKAMDTLKCNEAHLMKLLDRHKITVDVSAGTKYAKKVRTITEFFGQKIHNGTSLICTEYDDPWTEPKRENYIDKKSDAPKKENSFNSFNQRSAVPTQEQLNNKRQNRH